MIDTRLSAQLRLSALPNMMTVMMIALFTVCVASREPLLAPSRLRADGSDWFSSAAHARFALLAAHSPTFTWEPRHLERKHAIQSGFELNVFAEPHVEYE